MSLIEKLDRYHSSHKASEVWLVVILAAVVFGYLLYTFLSPISSEYRAKEEARHSKLTSSIDSADNFLKSITVNGDKNYYIKDLTKKVAIKREELSSIRAKFAKLDGAVEKLSTVLYNRDNWSKFLDDIAKKAEDSNLKVYNISNVEYDQNSSFGKVLDVNIKCQGRYGELLLFMNSLEKSQLVSNISYVKIEATPNVPVADINLTVWGVRP